MNAKLSTLVAGGLLLFGLVALVGIIALAALGQQVPGVLENLASGALGAFAALLARVGGDVQSVEVVNRREDAVPVDPAP